ncbi:MAG TPA: tryptophan halogenase family protein [Steroidobacteraceae bacterium]|nr:tryptophan halogenase family protein [Steroidobacteraceae bacterium]
MTEHRPHEVENPAADRRIRRIAIVGGGTAGWMAASALARLLGNTCSIQLIESAEIGTVGVGEATIPPILDFLRFLDIDQNNFVEQTQATFKLGIAFKDWLRPGHKYWHPFGVFGTQINRHPFYHFWHKARAQGLEPAVEHFSLEKAMGEANKFIFPGNSLGIAQELRYALHFDATLVARYLRGYAEHLGVVRLERKVVGATRRADGFIDELIFENGGRHAADLYIDCSGFRGLLIEDTLKTGYEDWTRYLPCDRAVAMPTAHAGPRTPYTLSTARPAGWQWRIPLQHRVGNGYVYCSSHVSDDAALDDLLGVLGQEPLADPRFLRFATGRRKQFWNGNCIALGLASGFLEPLESTSIHLVVSGLYSLIDHFPDKSFDPVNIAHYNEQLIEEFERVRDFIVLHYCATERVDSPLWQYCRSMAIPDSLAARMDIYRRTGRIFPHRYELFTDLSWFFVLDGMGIRPKDYSPMVDTVDFERVKIIMSEVRARVAANVAAAPAHDSFFRDAPQGDTATAKGWKLVSGRNP